MIEQDIVVLPNGADGSGSGRARRSGHAAAYGQRISRFAGNSVPAGVTERSGVCHSVCN